MTVAAREVLEDCRGAVDEIASPIQGRAWRRRWVTAVVLLRTVGYVLSTVDSKHSQSYKVAIADAWEELNNTKPDPKIFWSFINEQRQNIVHEYHFDAGQGATVHLSQNRPDEHHYRINSGAFINEDQRTVLRSAIAWWEEYLNKIDREAKKIAESTASS